MSTPNPEQPAPTPCQTALRELLDKQPLFDSVPFQFGFVAGWEANAAHAPMAVQEINKENFPAKQPVPDAGVRERIDKMIAVLCALQPKASTELAAFDWLECVNLIRELSAPTPATSEDTLMLDWLEKQATVAANFDTDLSVKTALFGWSNDPRVSSSLRTLRQALRAAMDHAGEQKT